MQHMPSTFESSVFGPQNPVNKLHFCSMHGISPSITEFQAQLAWMPHVLRFNSVFLAITKLLNAQATNRR